MNFLNFIFPEKNDNFNKARHNLKEIKKRFDGFIIDFPDVTPNEMAYINNEWVKLPKAISKGVEVMILNLGNNKESILTSYEPNSYVIPHKHNEYEFGTIIKGNLINKLNNQVFVEGDEYSFKPSQMHQFSSNDTGCLVYSALSDKSDFNLKPLPENIKSNLVST